MELTEEELQYRIIYSIIVAGKNAKFAEQAAKKLFPDSSETPFDVIRRWVAFFTISWNREIVDFFEDKDMVLYQLKKAKTGNYNKINKCLRELVYSNIDLRTCSAEDLEKIHGIGPKTARFFILWTRPDAKCAALDVHILRWLGTKGYKVPKATPNGKKYKELEQAFLDEAEKIGMTPAELDKWVWTEGSGWATWNPESFVSK